MYFNNDGKMTEYLKGDLGKMMCIWVHYIMHILTSIFELNIELYKFYFILYAIVEFLTLCSTFFSSSQSSFSD